jgi:hypothetical protein
MSEGQTTNPPSLRNQLVITVGAGIAATILTVLVVLPAEFGRDPTGFGRLTGLDKLAPAHEHVIEVPTGSSAPAQSQDMPFRTDTFEINLVPEGDKTGRRELEFKVRMKTNQALVYTWAADGAADGQFLSDLHGETTTTPEVQVAEFKQEHALSANGSLVAPMDGVHGWYWLNKSPNKVTVRLKLAGFYELIPPGETGNKAGILPSAETSTKGNESNE